MTEGKSKEKRRELPMEAILNADFTYCHAMDVVDYMQFAWGDITARKLAEAFHALLDKQKELSELHQRIKALEAEREQIAREAFVASRQEYVFKEGTILELRDKQFPTFQHYWQQKQKEQDDKR